MLVDKAKGNPGAINFIVQIDYAKEEIANPIREKIINCEIEGSDLYVLYSDLGGKSIEKTALICKSVPEDILKDACSRQDYSGRKLIAEFL
jgi:hypothetical protein